MVRWASSADFTGGCCQSCRIDKTGTGDAELGEDGDVCKRCCSEEEKEDCRNSEECKGSPQADGASRETNPIEEVNFHTHI